MSQVKLENVSGFVPIETMVTDRGRTRSQSAAAEPFGAHFWRVQAPSRETTGGGEPDPARLSRPQGAPADAPQQPTDNRDPAADDRRDKRHDSADFDADENATGGVSAQAASENDHTATAEMEGEADDPPRCETAEADSPTRQEQNTDADSKGSEGKNVDPHQTPRKLSLTQPDGQVDKGNAGQPASDPTSDGQERKDKGVPRHATASGQTEDANSAGKVAAGRATSQDGAALLHVSQGDPAAGANGAAAHAQATDGTAGQETQGAAGRGPNRSNRRGHQADKTPDQPERPQTQAFQAGALPRAEQQATGQFGRQGQQQPTGNRANAVAVAAARADAQAVSDRPAAADDERASLAGDRKAQAVDETAKPAATMLRTVPATPDSRPSAPLGISSNQDPRPGSTPQPHEAGESLQVDRARFVRRVAGALRAASKSSGTVRLRLSPRELGSLRLEIAVRGGAMTARVEAETTTARNLLLDNLPALRDRLAQQDIKVKQFDVALMDRSPGGLPDQTADHTQSDSRSGGGHAPQLGGDGDRDTKPMPGPGTVNRPGEGTRLNVVI
jgi:flagellar hook-length control protein FliK